MISNDFELIPHKFIQNISVKTTAKIQKNNLNNFIISSLQLNNIILNRYSKIFFSYIIESNIYEIYIFEDLNKNKNIYTQYHIFDKDKNDSKDINLFITNTFFVIYKNNKFYFAKENKSYEIEDILKFVQFKYKININKINIISNKSLKKYQEETKINNKINFVNIKKSNFLIYYIVYLICLCSLLYIFFNINQNTNNNTKMTASVKVYNNDKINILIRNLNKYNIYVNSIDYNTKYKLILYSKSIKNIYKFLNMYNNKINIKNLYESKKTYYMEIEIEV